MKYPPITAELLKSKNACQGQLDLFQTHFGDKPAPLTKEVFIEFNNLFDIDWAAEHLLDSSDFAEYQKATDTALAEYYKVRDTAYVEYEKIRDPALAEYKKAAALAFLTLYTA